MNKVAQEILRKLNENGYEAFLIGGYVRDYLLGKTSNDLDICTNATSQEVLKLFSGKANGYGSISIKLDHFTIDITTYRKEIAYKGRNPEQYVVVSCLKEDIVRRDFTINTICMDKDGKILDLLNGYQDLENKVIKMVGDTEEKIKEDPLRMLRAIRFATCLDFSLDEELNHQIQKHVDLAATLSGYRIKEELSKILMSPNYKKGIEIIKEFGLDNILGIHFTHLVYTSDICGMWAQIKLDSDLPFTKIEKKNIVMLQEILHAQVINNVILYTYGLYLSLVAGEILGIQSEAIHQMYENLPIYSKTDMAIHFLEIKTLLQIESNQIVGKIFDDLLLEVLNQRVENDFETLKTYLILNKARWLNNE